MEQFASLYNTYRQVQLDLLKIVFFPYLFDQCVTSYRFYYLIICNDVFINL